MPQSSPRNRQESSQEVANISQLPQRPTTQLRQVTLAKRKVMINSVCEHGYLPVYASLSLYVIEMSDSSHFTGCCKDGELISVQHLTNTHCMLASTRGW
jgi:hypothetical protein